MTAGSADTFQAKQTFSLPLYLSGLVVTLCGVLTVTYTVDSGGFTSQVLSLTLVGFLFSLGCRSLRVSSRVIEWLMLGLIAAAVYGTLTQRIDWGALMPEAAQKNEERLAVLLCGAAVLRSWLLFSDDAMLWTPLIAIAAIGLVSSFDLNTPVAVYFCGCVVATAFLLIHYHALRQQALASPQERARVISGLVAAQVGLAALCGLAVIGLGGALIVPLEAVSRNLSLGGAIRQLAKLGTPPAPGGNAARFADDATLMVGTGQGWSASPQVLLHVAPDDGQPHLWRGRTYDRYDGAGWISTEEGTAPHPVLEPESGDNGRQTFTLPVPVAPERPSLAATFDVVGDTDEFYYAADPRRLTLAAGPGLSPIEGLDGRIDWTGGSLMGAHYTVMSLLAPDAEDASVQARLRRAGNYYPASVRRLYLANMGAQGGGDLTPQTYAYYQAAVAQALRGLPPERRTPVDEALAIRDWVASRCTYSLAAPGIPGSMDHVYAFLAHTRRGYCDLFASAMTVLCRTAGIPARLVTGFAPGAQDGQEFDLRALDKHAWTEVYFPGEGWLAFDPTAGSRTDGSIPVSSPPHHWSWPDALRRLGMAPRVLLVLLLAVLLFVATTEWHARRLARRAGVTQGHRGAPMSGTGAGRRYTRMTRVLGTLGLPRAPAETPDEYAARARRFLAEQGPGAPDSATVGALTDQFTAARYGAAGPPSEAQVRAAERALQQFAASAGRLRRRQEWQRLGERVAAARSRGRVTEVTR